MSNILKDYLFKSSHEGISKSVGDLSIEHLGVLLSVMLMFEKLDVVSVKNAFDNEAQYSIEDQCVKDLFEWGYLFWEKRGVSFRINKEGIIWNEIVERYRMLKEALNQSKNGKQ